MPTISSRRDSAHEVADRCGHTNDCRRNFAISACRRRSRNHPTQPICSVTGMALLRGISHRRGRLQRANVLGREGPSKPGTKRLICTAKAVHLSNPARYCSRGWRPERCRPSCDAEERVRTIVCDLPDGFCRRAPRAPGSVPNSDTGDRRARSSQSALDPFGISRSMKQISKREMSTSAGRAVAYFGATGRISPS